eukprot:11037688-Lingulodinium_polyedra.AAC.1
MVAAVGHCPSHGGEGSRAAAVLGPAGPAVQAAPPAPPATPRRARGAPRAASQCSPRSSWLRRRATAVSPSSRPTRWTSATTAG